MKTLVLNGKSGVETVNEDGMEVLEMTGGNSGGVVVVVVVVAVVVVVVEEVVVAVGVVMVIAWVCLTLKRALGRERWLDQKDVPWRIANSTSSPLQKKSIGPHRAERHTS